MENQSQNIAVEGQNPSAGTNAELDIKITNNIASNTNSNIKNEYEINPATRLLTDRQRHVLVGLIGMCLVCLMSFSLLMLLNILKL